MTSNISVFGIYATRQQVERAIDEFKRQGFRYEDVSALIPTGFPSSGLTLENSTKTAEGAAAGATSGLIIGGVLGLLAAAGSIGIPGAGALIAAGPILSMFAGAGVGSALGSISGALIGLGLPEYEAKRYEGQIREGGILLSVHCDNGRWSEKAMLIMSETNADSISSAAEAPLPIQAGQERAEPGSPFL